MRIRTLSLLTVMSAVSLSAMAAAPTVSPEAKKAADMINADAPMQKMLTELTSPQGQKWRFNTQMEIVRIASPSRSEMRRQQELMRRFTEEWRFPSAQVMTYCHVGCFLVSYGCGSDSQSGSKKSRRHD